MKQGFLFFFFNDTATTEIYTLSLHDALPISDAAVGSEEMRCHRVREGPIGPRSGRLHGPDRKSTRLNSSHLVISYAVFCLKKKIHDQRPERSADGVARQRRPLRPRRRPQP